jgi:hypothetical protein
MERDDFEKLVQIAARAICANTNIAKRGQPEEVFDAPDDVTWDTSSAPPRALPRWALYEPQGRAVVESLGVVEIADALVSILKQIERGRNATAPQIVEHAFQDIEKLARKGLLSLKLGAR